MENLKGFFVIFLIGLHLMAESQTYSLQKALRTAVENNPNLRSLHRNIEIAEADLITAKLRPNPILNNQSLQLIQPTYFPANTTWENARNRQVWWQVTKPFLLPGVRDNKIEFALNNMHTTEQMFARDRQIFLSEVANKWIDTWLAANRIADLQFVKTETDSLTLQKAGTRTEGLQMEMFLRQLAIQLRTANLAYENELTKLQVLLGTSEMARPDTTADVDKIFAFPGGSVRETSWRDGAEILSLKYLSEAAKSNIKLQRSLAWPAPELGLIYNPQNSIRYVGLFGTLHIPVFTRNQGEIKKAGIQSMQSEEILNYKLMQLQAENLSARRAMENEEKNLKDTRDLLLKAKEVLGDTKQAYRSKNAEPSEYIEGIKSQLEIRQLYLQSLENYMRSRVHLLLLNGALNPTGN